MMMEFGFVALFWAALILFVIVPLVVWGQKKDVKLMKEIESGKYLVKWECSADQFNNFVHHEWEHGGRSYSNPTSSTIFRLFYSILAGAVIFGKLYLVGYSSRESEYLHIPTLGLAGILGFITTVSFFATITVVTRMSQARVLPNDRRTVFPSIFFEGGVWFGKKIHTWKWKNGISPTGCMAHDFENAELIKEFEDEGSLVKITVVSRGKQTIRIFIRIPIPFGEEQSALKLVDYLNTSNLPL